MKARLLLLLAAILSLSSCAGFMEKAQIYAARAQDGFEDHTGITLGQGFDLLTGAYAGWQAARDANRISASNAGSPVSPHSAKAVQPVQPEASGWWNTLFLK